MANLKRTRNKLMRSGYLPNCQVREDLIKTRTVETWIDIQKDGTPISFYIKDGTIDGDFKVHGHRPSLVEFDEFNDDRTNSISKAITLSRCYIPGE